jgi:hypothetical protein
MGNKAHDDDLMKESDKGDGWPLVPETTFLTRRAALQGSLIQTC